jgi:hypothetical protein
MNMLRKTLAAIIGVLWAMTSIPATASSLSTGNLISGEVRIGGNGVIPLPPGSWVVRGSFDTYTPLTPAPGASGVAPSQKVRNLVLSASDREAPITIMTLQWTEFARVNWNGHPCRSGSMSSRPFKNALDTNENSTRVKCIAGVPMEGFPDQVRRGGDSTNAASRLIGESLQPVIPELQSNAFSVYGYMSQLTGDRVSWHLYFNLDRLGLDRTTDLVLNDSSRPSSTFLNGAAWAMMDWSRQYLAAVEAGFWPSLFSSQRASAPNYPQSRGFHRFDGEVADAGSGPAGSTHSPPQANGVQQPRPSRKGLNGKGLRSNGSTVEINIVEDEGDWLTFTARGLTLFGAQTLHMYRGIVIATRRDSDVTKTFSQTVQRLFPLEAGKVEQFTHSRDGQTWQYTVTVKEQTTIETPLGPRDVFVIEVDHRGIVKNHFHEIETVHLDREYEIPWRRDVKRISGTPSPRFAYSLSSITNDSNTSLLSPTTVQATKPSPPTVSQTTQPVAPSDAERLPAPVALTAQSAPIVSLQPPRPEPVAPVATADSRSRERRVALVIGNAAYRTAPLRNPANDAEDMAEALKALDFEVLQARNASLREMRSIMRRFSDEIETSNVALVYYAGHGIELNGRNYLIPTDADIQREYEIADQAFDAALILSMLDESSTRNRQRVNIVILDACRNNDLPRSLRNVRSGLARMDAPVGTFIAFSTAPGRVALDGDGRNSPFTQSLLASIRETDQSIEQVFKNVRRAVVDQTRGSQIPWESSSLIGDFYFRSQTRR